MRLMRVPREGAIRTVRMHDGTALSYRLNRGDIQAIREIWRDEVYKPGPDLTALRHLVDLGANIGFTSVYLARRLNLAYVVAVEPDPANARILRRNLEQNGVPARVVQAAVGPTDERGAFQRDRDSNVGRLDAAGDLAVRILSMPSVIGHLPAEAEPTLLKVDIEGGEEKLFSGDVSWLARFDCLMAEFHPTLADAKRIVRLIEASGLHFRAGGVRGEPTACWIRARRAWHRDQNAEYGVAGL
jgi:FkbM family methyltransferase